MNSKPKLWNIALFAIALFLIMPLTGSTSLRTGLVGEWRFDEGYGTIAYDASDQENNGTITGATWTSSGKYGKALVFDGVNGTSGSRVDSNLVYKSNNAFTLSAWIKPKTTGSFKIIMGSYIGDNVDAGLILMSDNRFSFHEYSTESVDRNPVISPVDTIQLNQWQHVAATYDNGDIILYHNGIKVGEGNYNLGGSNNHVIIGSAKSNSLNRGFNGTIDEVRIYNRTLTQDEITSLYNYADLSCSMTTSCDYTDIFHMSNETNAHAELNNNSNYAYEVCCYDPSGFSLGTSCSGDYETLLHLSNQTNAHAEQNNESNYSFNVCINSNSSGLNCSYEPSCSEYDTCVASISSSTNAHVARCGYYDTQICCRFTNEAPTLDYLNLTPVSPYTTDDLYVNVTCSDNDAGDTITAYWNIYKNNSIQPAQGGSSAVTTGVNTLVKTIDSSNTIKHDQWVAELWCGDGRINTTKQNTSTRTILNSPPSKVNLSYPENNDSFFTNRTPRFNWTAATDADNDALTYQILISLNPDASSPLTNETGISNEYYIQPSELDFATYYWKVRANDSEVYGNWSDIWNFTLIPSVSIILVNDSINFGTMAQFEVNDTTNNHPEPFRLENDGNTEANVSVKSSSLWQSSSAQLNTSYYQFKADNSTETNSFSWIHSQTTWAYMSDVYKSIIAILNHTDSNDLAEIDIRVEVASDEPPGPKSAVLTFYAEES